VLLRAVNVVRERVVHCNVIKLCGRLVILCGPCFAPIGRNAYAAVIRIAHSIRILRINPETMMVSVPCRQEIESLAAIDLTEETGVHDIGGVWRFRISVNLAEIPGTLTKSA